MDHQDTATKTPLDEFASCQICPRRCGSDRRSGPSGFCMSDARMRIARAALHHWEEPPISGDQGSGTIFFTGCNLSCVFCQNSAISYSRKRPKQKETGRTLTLDEFVEVCFDLKEQGAHNINLVTAGHFLPLVVEGISACKRQGLDLPFVYNTSSYETVESLRRLDGLIDIYLPDLKFRDSHLSARYLNAADYFAVASKAIGEMFRQVGRFRFAGRSGTESGSSPVSASVAGTQIDSSPVSASVAGTKIDGSQAGASVAGTQIDGNQAGASVADTQIDSSQAGSSLPYTRSDASPSTSPHLLEKGLVLRLLLMPGQLRDAKQLLAWAYRRFGDDIMISLMDQYTPLSTQLVDYPELDQRVDPTDYDEWVEQAMELGIRNAFIQEPETQSSSFIPDFSMYRMT